MENQTNQAPCNQLEVDLTGMKRDPNSKRHPKYQESTPQ